MAPVLDALDQHRGIASLTTVEDVATVYRNLTNCDPERDMVCAEVDGRLVAYSRVTWWDEVAGDHRIYFSAGFVHPRWQSRGIGSAFVDWNLARLAEISGGHDTARRRVVDRSPSRPNVSRCSRGTVSRRSVARRTWSVPTWRICPTHPCQGLEVRPVEDGHLREIWDGHAEAFADHPGMAAETEEAYRAFLEFPHHDPRLWRVAWEGDQVAGQVRSFSTPPRTIRSGAIAATRSSSR